jgi:hypothetical protein
MAAIITSEFRKNSRQIFINDIKTSTVDDYFIGLGKTDSWPDTADAEGNQVTEYSRQFSAPVPTDTIINKTDVLKNLMVLVKTKAAEVFNVIPRNNWSFNRIYKLYDPTDPRCFDYETIDGVAHYPCYVTSNDRIYFCLSNTDSNGEIVESTTAIPSGVGATQTSSHSPAKLGNGEGYIWAYVTALDEDSKFYTDQFVNYTYPTGDLYTDIKSDTGGLVYGFKVINGGGATITTLNTTIKLVGTTRDGSGDIVPRTDVVIKSDEEPNTDFNVVFGANGIESITYKEPVNTGDSPSWKTDFLSASVLVEVTDGAAETISETIEIVPYVLPYEGLGRYPDNDLPSFYAGIAVDFIGDVDGEAPAEYSVDLRQISLIKNPTRNPLVTQANDNDDDAANPDGFYTHDEAYDALKYITLPPTTLVKDYVGRDFIIEQKDTGARAWLDYADNINERLYYHQNSSPLVNFKKFSNEATGSIKITSIAGFWDGITYQSNGATNPEYLPETGEVIFYENRKPINRNYNQTDEVKLVIQF